MLAVPFCFPGWHGRQGRWKEKLPFFRNRSWRWVRLFPLVQAGLRGGCNICKKRIRASLPAPHTDHPGAPQKERALLWGTRLGNDSTVLMKAGTGPLHPPPGTLELETGKSCQGHLPSGTHWQFQWNDSSSTTKTLVTFQRIMSLPKIVLWHASTCNVMCNTPRKGGLGNSAHQTCYVIAFKILNFYARQFDNLQCRFQVNNNACWATGHTQTLLLMWTERLLLRRKDLQVG